MKITSLPSHCARCYGQYSDRRYVDMDAAFDGPVIELPDGTRQSIDDMIVCEKCIADAARLFGMSYEEEQQTYLELLESKNDALHERVLAQDELIRSQEDTIMAQRRVKEKEEAEAA